jgi:hypothetical protein
VQWSCFMSGMVAKPCSSAWIAHVDDDSTAPKGHHAIAWQSKYGPLPVPLTDGTTHTHTCDQGHVEPRVTCHLLALAVGCERQRGRLPHAQRRCAMIPAVPPCRNRLGLRCTAPGLHPGCRFGAPLRAGSGGKGRMSWVPRWHLPCLHTPARWYSMQLSAPCTVHIITVTSCSRMQLDDRAPAVACRCAPVSDGWANDGSREGTGGAGPHSGAGDGSLPAATC